MPESFFDLDSQPQSAPSEPVRSEGVESEQTVFGLSSSASKPTQAKLAIPLTDDGKIDLSTMREKTLSRLRSALKSTPDLLPREAKAEEIPDWMIGVLYHLLGSIEQLGFAKKYPDHADLVQSVFTYTPDDMAILAQPTKAVLAKYVPRIEGKEEIALGLALVSVHISKTHTLNELVARREGQNGAKTEAPKAA